MINIRVIQPSTNFMILNCCDNTSMCLFFRLCLLFLVANSFISLYAVNSQTIPCKQVTDCRHNDKSRAQCSYCVGYSSSSAKCVFPFTRVYNATHDFYCEPLSSCGQDCVPTNTANCYYGQVYEHGILVPSYNPVCVCKPRFYGKSCENKDPEGFEIVKSVNIKYVEFFPGENVDALVTVRAYDLITVQRTYIHITKDDPSDGFFVIFSCARCSQKCREGFKTESASGALGYRYYNLQLRAPFKRFTKQDKSFLFLGDYIYGYKLDMKIKALTADVVGKEIERSFFVRYTGTNQQSLECIAMIELNNCGASLKKAVVYKRFSNIMITRSVLHLKDGQRISTSVIKPECANGAKKVWKMWIVNSESDHTFEYISQPIVENYVNKTLVFPPFSLEIGKYKLLHEVKYVGNQGTSLNYRYCYFKVKTVLLVALVYGSSARRIFKDHGLTLVSRSWDPNSPLEQQSHLWIRWSCKPKNLDSGPKKGHEVYQVSPSELEYGAEYNFTLTVWTEKYDDCEGCGKVGPVYSNVIITVALENETSPGVMPTELRCIQNCGALVMPNRVLILRVLYNPYGENAKYAWSYYKEGEDEAPTVAIEQKLDFTSMLIVDEDKLLMGAKYTIVVRDLITGLMANYSFVTDNLLYTGICTVVPDNGTKGIDLFDIECSVSETEEFRYEFYDKTNEEVASGDIFNGRMLGTSKTGFIHGVRLTRGHVMVYVYNDHGLSVTKSPSVSLNALILDEAMKVRISNELQEVINMGEVSAIIGYISFIPDILPDDEDKTPMANTLLDAFQSIGMSRDLGDVKQWTSTMANVLLSLNKPKHLALEPSKVGVVMDNINLRAEALSDSFLRGRDASKWMSPREVKTLSRSVLNCVLAGVISKDDDYVGADEENTSFQTLEELRKGSDFADKTMENLKDVMSFVQTPGQPPSKIVSSEERISLWAMEHDEEYSVRNMLDKAQEIPIEISNALVSDLEVRLRSHEELTIQVAALEENLFWWDKTYIDSTLTSVSLSRQTRGREMHKITRVETPMNVTVRLTESFHKNITCSGTVRVDKTNDWDALDDSVRVHRLDPEPRSIVNVKFHFPLTNGSIRVSHSISVRPDYEMMIQNSMIINDSNPSFSYFYDIHERLFLYLGVLPGPDPPINQSVGYSFEVTTMVCQLWARDAWTSKGCKISTESANGNVHCMCKHFSIFAAAFPVPPEKIDPFGDAKLFLTVLDNPLVVAFVTFLLIAFLIICAIMRCLDKRDDRLKSVVVLDDNFPDDRHPYLLAVYTSSRFNAGCTSHVGFRVTGSQAESRTHIFYAKDRNVLRRDTDDWFVMYCAERLGELQSIHLWHDNSGSSPDWFVEKILVFDLLEHTEYQFLVEQWLALRVDSFPEAFVLMAKARDLRSVKRMFLDNFVFGLREGHLVISLVSRHPRSEISRVQRVGLFTVCIMASMLCSIMFFRPEGSDSGVDSEDFSIGMRELIISIQCVVVSVIITSVVTVLFRMSYKTVAEVREKRDTLMLRDSNEDTRAYYPEEIRQKSRASIFYDVHVPKEKRRESTSMYKNFVRIVSKTMKTRSLIPVQGPNSRPVVKTRTIVYVIAWIVCLSVITGCAYLVMLYGLKMGAANSKKWLSSVLMSMSEEMAIAGPARLLTAALLLSFAHKKMFEVTSHKIGADEALELRPPNDDDYFERLLIRRFHPMYAPLSEDVKKTMLAAQQARNNWWTTCDFVVCVAFVVILNQLVFSIWSSHYYATHKIDRMITSPLAFPSNATKSNLHDVRDIDGFEKYLKHTFVAVTYKFKWYNGEKKLSPEGVDGKYWAYGNVNRMVGEPRVRQQRTLPVRCRTLVGDDGLCAPPWSEDAVDDDAYGEGWTPATAEDVDGPWTYADAGGPAFAAWLRTYAGSGRPYGAGGFSATLPTDDRERAEGVLGRLETFRWQDLLTRAAFLEFTLYNVNMDMFSQVTLVVEYLVSSETIVTSRVTTVEGKFNVNTWYLLFVVFVVYYCVRLGYLVNQQGLLDYLKCFNNKCRLLVVVLGFLVIFVALAHYYISSNFITEFRRKGKEEYFDFDQFYNFFTYLQIVLSLLMSVAIVRMFMLIRLGRPLISHFYTFVISWRWVVWVTIVAFLLFHVLSSVANLTQLVLRNGIKDIAILKAPIHCKNYAWDCFTLYFFAIKLITHSIVMGMFVVMFLYYVKIAKVYKLKPTDDFNFIVLVSEKLMKCCNKRK